MILYANDTNVLITDRSPDTLQTKLSLVVKQLEIWFLYNDLLINSSKTVDMSFHLCHSIPTYKPQILLQNNGIEYKNEVKFLGLYITGNLNWRAHICYLCNNLSKYVFVIKSVKKNFQQPGVLEHLFRIISCATQIWDYTWGGAKVSIKALRIRNKVIRLITGLKRLESCGQKFKENAILTVNSIYIFEVLCCIKKHRDELKKNCEIHDHNTRSKHDLHTQSHNTS